MTDPIATAAVHSLGKIADFSIAGASIIVLLLSGAYILRYFMNEFKECHNATKEALQKNTDAFKGVELVLARIETRLTK